MAAKKNTLQEPIRKLAILLLLIGFLLPVLMINIAVYAKGPFSKLNRPFIFPRALLLCQQWSLFGYIVPFNYTMHFEVAITNGEVRELHDLIKERAGKWQPVFFYGERKAQNNMYSDRRALRYYMEYLIRTNGIDPAQVTRRTISLRYRNVLAREAADAGTYYGPETEYVFDSY